MPARKKNVPAPEFESSRKELGDGMDQLLFKTAKEWNRWLTKHHAASGGLWVRFAKQTSGIPSITHAEALDLALCYGWIDGQAQSLDKDCWLQKFTPRRDASIWSRINVAKALRLIEEGRMQPAGLAAIDRAKSNGRWDAAYSPQRDKTLPDDLSAAIGASPRAAAFFQTLDSRNRYAILFRVQTARKPETRNARIRKFVGMLERHETLH